MGQLVQAYDSFLVEHRGLGDSSRGQYRKALSEFVSFLESQGRTLAGLLVTDLDQFFLATAALGLSKVHLGLRVYAVRGFLRYLHGEGWLTEDLAPFVDGPRIYREANVPAHFTWEELRQLMESVQGESPTALRDRALLVLLCVYGLRSKEVAHLTLDDIDWTHALLRVPHRKMGTPLVLPLLPEVREVLAHYVRAGRPADAPHRVLLLTQRGKPFRDGWAVTSRIHELVGQAGLTGGRGAHAIRRAVGTRLVERGLGLGEVACILGHSQPDSARVYLRLSLELLRDVAAGYGELL
jgi:site-specific recombinase XerD